jgi:hypothetical protein
MKSFLLDIIFRKYLFKILLTENDFCMEICLIRKLMREIKTIEILINTKRFVSKEKTIVNKIEEKRMTK